MQNFILNTLQSIGWSVSGNVAHLLTSGKEYRYVFHGETVDHQTCVNGEWVHNDTISVKDFHDKLRSDHNG